MLINTAPCTAARERVAPLDTNHRGRVALHNGHHSLNGDGERDRDQWGEDERGDEQEEEGRCRSRSAS